MSTPRRTQLARLLLFACVPLTLVGAAPAIAPTPTDDPNVVAVVLAPRQRALLAAEVPGQVTAVCREFGAAFPAGEVLIRLDDRLCVATQQAAEARRAAAEVDLLQAQQLATQRTRERHAEASRAAAEARFNALQRLYDDGQASVTDLEAARRDVALATTELELAAATAAKDVAAATRERAAAQREVQIAAHDTAACTVAAPFSGRVARVLTQPHEQVERGTPLIELVDDTHLLAKFLVPANRFAQVQRGQTVTLRIDETGTATTARISHIAATLDPASRTLEVFAEVDNTAGAFRAGMNGRLDLRTLSTEAAP